MVEQSVVRDLVAPVLFVVGLIGMIANVVRMFMTAKYETTRPWAGLQTRARTRKDGSVCVQTYYSKGPAATKMKMKEHWSFWLCFAAFWTGLLIG